jgi:hypothetical protein
LRDLTEVHRNAGNHDAKARRKIAGAKSNNFGILRRLRWYRPNQDLRTRRATESRPLPDPFLSWDYIGTERIGSD